MKYLLLALFFTGCATVRQQDCDNDVGLAKRLSQGCHCEVSRVDCAAHDGCAWSYEIVFTHTGGASIENARCDAAKRVLHELVR